MKKNTFYLSINTTSLAHYISKALILPSRMYKNRPSDIQTLSNDYLILSKKKFINSSNCSIEIVLDSVELDAIESTEDENIFFYKHPIPLSRIIKVHFQDEEQKLITVYNIEEGTGYIPDFLVAISDEKSYEYTSVPMKEFNYSNEIEEKIKTYNQVLGGVAFTRYNLDGEYSKNFLSLISLFNQFIKQKLETSGNAIYTKYNGAFTHQGEFWSTLSPLLYEKISKEDVENIAQKEKITIQKSNGIFQYQNLDKNNSITYKLAILHTYGEDSTKRKKTSDLLYDYKTEKIPKDKVEGISLIYGINNGYSSFYNFYDKKIVKFKMDSLLDYYIIESIFQYVINNKKENREFEYINDILPTQELELDLKTDNTKQVKEKHESLESLLNFAQNNIFEISPKELIGQIWKKFENLLYEKDNEIKKLNNKILELENQEINNSNTVLPLPKDNQNDKVLIEKVLSFCSKNKSELQKIAKEKSIHSASKATKEELIKLILTNKDRGLL